MEVPYPLFFAARKTGRTRLVDGVKEHEFETEHGMEWREVQIIGVAELPDFIDRLLRASAHHRDQS